MGGYKIMTYLWFQTIGGVGGHTIDPTATPPEALADAHSAIERALSASQAVPIARRLGYWLRATAERRRLLLTVLAPDTDPIVTIAVAPRDRDGAKLWPLMVQAAKQQGQQITFPRPQEPWAVVLAYSGIERLVSAGDIAWLPVFEADLASAWLGMITK